MSRVKQITVLISQTHNLGNYNSLRVEYSEVVEIQEGDDLISIRDAAYRRVSEEVERICLAEKPVGVTANTARRK